MKIFHVEQIRAMDAYTIAHEPIASIDLMERASQAFVRWFCNQYVNTRPIAIFCGKGNNGGDGLAIARILSGCGYDVQVFIAEYTLNATDDFRQNYARLGNHLAPRRIHSENDLPTLGSKVVCIDALLGSGLSRPVEGLLSIVIQYLNGLPNRLVSVDIASGLYTDQSNGPEDVIIKPKYTVTFQLPKLAFLLPQNAEYVGEWHIVDIGLSTSYITDTATPNFFTDKFEAEKRIKPRQKFSHKGTFGHAVIIAGSYGKMGAAVLSGRACLRSGVGLLTMHVPTCGYEIMQVSVPEAMTTVDEAEKYVSKLPDLSSATAIGIGPGLGQNPATVKALEKVLEQSKVPVIIDADALNILSTNRHLLYKLPENTILTPHPKEFQRLVGESGDEYERLEKARAFAAKYKAIICLKGANTAVVLPNGEIHFNSTGNPGMATGGTGDVLTGIITSLLAQKYDPADAAILGVYQHGAAGDRAAEARGQTALIASDVIEHLGW
ncbi:NAD(P)H-hydrate dehydratase [Dyadobacter fermentans]|uniref:NAD(P)H-hydrate dehydratase n=1 Tax=Dyadobacter fermentans TaxID=94254 RepID=UPI001CBFDA3A|nr:NAD(P)H-hydrate dehydratase [Dyadobacter fermentans]MBZ1358225.1 NAD(P)H-hydrate dehydratase [Dyadobacter fermentans]